MKTNKLKALIVEAGMTQQDVAHHLGITPKTFYSKMKKGVFGTDEVTKMIAILKIENPAEIFLESE